MPSKSKAQHNLMAMVANDLKAAKRLGIPQSVGAEFMKKDKGKKKYAMGGIADMDRMGKVSPRKRMDMKGSGPMKYAKGGSVTRADGVCTKGHTKGKTVR